MQRWINQGADDVEIVDYSLTAKPVRPSMARQMHTIAIHPGRVLLDELQERGITQSALASHIGVLSKTINEIVRGKRGLSAEMAVKLESGRANDWP